LESSAFDKTTLRKLLTESQSNLNVKEQHEFFGLKNLQHQH